MLNQLIIQGNLTKDPELKYLQSGAAVMECSIACKETIQSNGNKYDEVTFLDFTFWGSRGESFHKYFKKGDEVLLTGKLKLNQWESNGTKMKKHKLKGETFNFTRGGTKRVSDYPQQDNYENEYQNNSYKQTGHNIHDIKNDSYKQTVHDVKNIPAIEFNDDEIPF